MEAGNLYLAKLKTMRDELMSKHEMTEEEKEALYRVNKQIEEEYAKNPQNRKIGVPLFG
ncbi:MAG: hypothetical protein QXI87_08040 [Thermoproteota archaeon]